MSNTVELITSGTKPFRTHLVRAFQAKLTPIDGVSGNTLRASTRCGHSVDGVGGHPVKGALADHVTCKVCRGTSAYRNAERDYADL